MTDDLTAADARLLLLLGAAKRALRYLENEVAGNALNPPQEDLLCGRELKHVITMIETEQRMAELVARR